MNTQELSNQLQEIFGCLKHLRTDTGRRHYGQERDQDLLLPGRSPFRIDYHKLVHSKAGRRLDKKTQVMTLPENNHIRSRLTHTLEVASIARFIAEVLGLNPDLAEAIAFGHDIGHTPFGHPGEDYIEKKTGKPFRHSVFAVVIAEQIERDGDGLNMTHEVLRSIRDHSLGKDVTEAPSSMLPEAADVSHADRIAYCPADYNDMIRVGIPLEEELIDAMESLGENQRERENNLVTALCLESAEAGRVSFSKSETARTFYRAKRLMYKVYDRLNVSGSAEILEKIYNLIVHVWRDEVDPILLLALMTDQDAALLAEQTIPNIVHLNHTTAAEFGPKLRGKQIEWWKAPLDW